MVNQSIVRHAPGFVYLEKTAMQIENRGQAKLRCIDETWIGKAAGPNPPLLRCVAGELLHPTSEMHVTIKASVVCRFI
jgi:hypothetical protein